MTSVARSSRGHRQLPHTADVILQAWGCDLASCLEEAVTALIELYVDPGDADVVEWRPVHVQPGPDPSLVLAVLDEIVFTLDTADGVPIGAEVHTGSDGGLDVVLVLADPRTVTATGAVPKAVSRSELEVEARAGIVRCRFLVDV
jgi:SHS2 domain-containing protein